MKIDPTSMLCSISNDWDELEFISNRLGALMGVGSLWPRPLASFLSLKVHFMARISSFWMNFLINHMFRSIGQFQNIFDQKHR
jgi:hypothetical protein